MGRNASRGKGGSKKKRRRKTTADIKRKADSLRFQIGDKVECCTNNGWATATIVKIFYNTEMDIGIVPYQLQCDNGALLFAPADTEEYVRPSASPPMPIEFATGTRVEFKYCQVEDWKLGTIISTDENWADVVDWGSSNGVDIMAKNAPYKINFDDGRIGSFWGPPQWLRYSAPPLPIKFHTGARVECKMVGETSVEEEWRSGTVISSNKNWIEINYSPYYIKLDDGTDLNFYGPEENIRGIELRFKVSNDLYSLSVGV